MSLKPPPEDRTLSADDPALRSASALLEFLLSLGADEFTLRFLYLAESEAPADRLHARLAGWRLGEREREATTGSSGEGLRRAVEVWRLDRRSIAVLREMLPDDTLARDWAAQAWPEDLCVYRRGALVFGAVTHEGEAFLRLARPEWQRWQAWAETGRGAT